MSRSGIALVWFRRDLRLADNPALSAAVARCDRVIPLYIHAPDEAAPWTPGSASNWWLHHSLCALQRELRQAGSSLVIARGPTLERLRSIIRQTGATHLFWNRNYDPASISRDGEIKQTLSDHGLACQSFNGNLLSEPASILTGQGTPYKVFTAYWRTVSSQLHEIPPPLPPVQRLSAVPPNLPSLDPADLALCPQIPWDADFRSTWQAGEQAALERWEQFLFNTLPAYDRLRDLPASEGTSRLSPHLHFGEISPRQLLWGLQHQADRSPAMTSHLDRLHSQIGWREFAHYTLFHSPDSANQSLDRRFEKLAWPDSDGQAELLQAWQQGKTGIPIVDAGMRELWQTGWMHNRVRMIVASLLTKNLGIHWLHGARWFWDTLLDADLANNSLGWQWCAGCGVDAAPYFRIFNPATQARRFDPEGRYIKRWLPALAGADKNLLYNGRLSDEPIDYPLPVLDLSLSRRQALERWERIKRQQRE